MPQKQIVLLQSLAAMPSTVRNMLEEHVQKHMAEQQPLQDETINNMLRDLISYETKALSAMVGTIAEKAPRHPPGDDLQQSPPSEKTRDDLLDQFEALRKETLSFLTQRLPQDWEQKDGNSCGESLTLRQHTINLTEHDRDTRNKLRVELK